jgi:hypothetical protein
MFLLQILRTVVKGMYNFELMARFSKYKRRLENYTIQ